MEIDAFLCDHAEAADGKLFINGAAINIVWAQPQPPHMIDVYVAAVIQVPYTATNQAHTVSVSMRDEDGQTVVPWTPPGADPAPAVEMTTTFNLGRPPMLPPGEVQVFPLAFGFQLPVGQLGLYSFVIAIDGTEMKRLPLRVMVMPQQSSFGPASIPPLG